MYAKQDSRGYLQNKLSGYGACSLLTGQRVLKFTMLDLLEILELNNIYKLRTKHSLSAKFKMVKKGFQL